MTPRFAFGVLVPMLVALIGVEAAVLRSGPERAVLKAAEPATRPPAPPPLEDRSTDWAAIVLARPLFTPGRRAPPPPPPAAAATPPLPPRLAGTVVSPFDKRALFAGDGEGKPVTVGEGGRVGIWMVQAIGAGIVTLAGPGGTRELRVASDRPARSDMVAPLAEVEPSWANPCGRPHLRAGYKPSTPKTERCALVARRGPPS